MGSTEHYGAVVNLDFDYIRYLDETRGCGLNLVRVFSGAYRENQGAFDIQDNTLVPLPGRFVAPWKRSEVPGALLGGNKFDLTQWDPAYFFRLRDFVREAGKRGIVVELALFSAIYEDGMWNFSPMNTANHVNGVGANGRLNVYNVNSDLLPFHKALARKCADELRQFDNVIIEICNEPYFSNNPLAAWGPWQAAIVDELVAASEGFPTRPLIAQNIANFSGVIGNPDPDVSLFNFHYALPEAALANYGLNRAIGNDETGFAGQIDLPYRIEAWEFMLSGGGLVNHLDYSYTSTFESGIASWAAPGGGGPSIRRQLGVLRWFMEELPLLQLRPQPALVTGGVPVGGSVRAIGVPGVAYGLYLRGGSQAELVIDLPEGTYLGRWIDPRSGLATGSVSEFTHPGGPATLVSPAYGEDIALHLFSSSQASAQVTLTSPPYNSIISSDANQLTLTAEAVVAASEIQGVEFLDGETSLGVVTTPPYSMVLSSFKEGNHIFRARAITADGREGLSPPIKSTVVGSFVYGANLNGPAVVVDGESYDSEADAVVTGLVITNATPGTNPESLTLYPTPDAGTAELLSRHLLRQSAEGNAGLGLSKEIPNGYYDVFFFLIEGSEDYSRDIGITLEGRSAGTGIGDLALGEWHKYGPYRTHVTDGNLDVVLSPVSKGIPKIAALSVYQASPPPEPAEAELKISQSEGMVVLTYPAGLPAAIVEWSDDLAQTVGWDDLQEPPAEFSDLMVIPLPVEVASRFFRLRLD